MRGLNGVIQQLADHQAVGQSSQRVVGGEMLEFLFDVLAFGDVPDDPFKADGLAGCCFLQGHGRLNVRLRPIFSFNAPVEAFRGLARFKNFMKRLKNNS